MKRIVSLVLCMALALGAVTYRPPQAKAVVFEGSVLGSLYGSVLGSLGLTYAAGGMNNQSFGLAIWDLMTSWYTDMTPEGESALDFFGNLASAGIQAMAPGQILLNQSLIESISQFAHWLYDKYALSENESAVVFDNSSLLSLSATNSYGTLNYPDSVTITKSNKFITFEIELDTPGRYVCSKISDLPSGGNPFIYQVDILTPSRSHVDPSNISEINRTSWNMNNDANSLTTIWDLTDSDFADGSLLLRMVVASASDPYWGYINPGVYSLQQVCSFVRAGDAVLSVSAPNGLTISDVEAVTPEQAYALTFEGVTATDVEGIVNEAVGRILDGTYSAAGEITDALDVPQDLTWQEHIAQIWENIKALPQTIAQAIASAFVPDATLVDEITTTFNSKFGWLETVHRFGTDLFGMTAETEPPVIYIHLEDAEGKYTYGDTEKALDLSWYQRYKSDVDHILSGFMWLAFLWLVFKRASSIIQGGEMITEYTHDIDQGHK